MKCPLFATKSRRKGNLLNLLKELGPIKLAPRHQPKWTDRRADAALRPGRKKRGR